MSFAFTHLIGAWILGKAYEHSRKNRLSRYAWFFLLFGAILPDADHLIDWILGTDLHRTFTHSLLFAIIVPLLLFVILSFLHQPERRDLLVALGTGILTHLLLDALTSPMGVPLLWPSGIYFSITHIGPLAPGTHHFLQGTPKELVSVMKTMILDMGLGTAWIFYLWWRKRIEF